MIGLGDAVALANAPGVALGPVRFSAQPAWIRKRGRKQLAGLSPKKRRKHKDRREAYKAGYTSLRSARKSGWGRSATRAARSAGRGTARSAGRRSRRSSGGNGYSQFLTERAETYGPVRFAKQPRWVRARGRKGTARKGTARRGASYGLTKKARRAANRAAYRTSDRRSSKRSRKTRSRSSRGETKKERRAANRAAFRASRQSGSRRGARRSGRSSRSARGGSRRASAGPILTYNQLMKRLRGTKLKAWVCAGPKRTGCGGGRKGRRGSRVMGVLRP